MDTLVKTTADEINSSLIDYIKKAFKGKKIAVHIYEDQEDETDYLLNDAVTKKRLLESVENVSKNSNLKEYSIKEIESILNDDGV